MKKLFNNAVKLFIQGLVALLPLIVTIYVMAFLLSFLDGIAGKSLVFLPDSLKSNSFLPFLIQTLTIVLLLTTVAVFGLLIRTIVGKGVIHVLDSFFGALPGLNAIYKATKQVIDVFRSSKRQFFTNPVLVEYPTAGIWAVAFNTGEASGSFALDGNKMYTVFIPTTPNPTSGFLALVPSSRIRSLNVPVEEAIKMILTGGLVKSDPDREKNNSELMSSCLQSNKGKL